jgi:hypothetical protein
MKYADALPGVLILVLRLACIAPARWALDWIAVLSLLWILVALSPKDSRVRTCGVGVACSWLVAIYAMQQAAWTFAGWH